MGVRENTRNSYKKFRADRQVIYNFPASQVFMAENEDIVNEFCCFYKKIRQQEIRQQLISVFLFSDKNIVDSSQSERALYVYIIL